MHPLQGLENLPSPNTLFWKHIKLICDFPHYVHFLISFSISINCYYWKSYKNKLYSRSWMIGACGLTWSVKRHWSKLWKNQVHRFGVVIPVDMEMWKGEEMLAWICSMLGVLVKLMLNLKALSWDMSKMQCLHWLELKCLYRTMEEKWLVWFGFHLGGHFDPSSLQTDRSRKILRWKPTEIFQAWPSICSRHRMTTGPGAGCTFRSCSSPMGS